MSCDQWRKNNEYKGAGPNAAHELIAVHVNLSFLAPIAGARLRTASEPHGGNFSKLQAKEGGARAGGLTMKRNIAICSGAANKNRAQPGDVQIYDGRRMSTKNAEFEPSWHSEQEW